MTIKNLIIHSEMHELPKWERDRYLVRKFHLAPGDLAHIRRESAFERTRKAAITLHERLSAAEIDESIIPSQFTLENLGYLIDDRSFSTPPNKLVANALKRRYQRDIPGIVRRTGLRPTYTQLLREELKIYGGNLYEAKRTWPLIEVSRYDWLKDMRIPTEIGLRESTLLGMLAVHGRIDVHSQNDSQIYSMELWGRNIDFRLYGEVTLPWIKAVFNDIPFNISEEPSTPNLPNPELTPVQENEEPNQYTRNVPGYRIDSLVLSSWLIKHMGFSTETGAITLPQLGEDEQKLGIFRGAIAGSARLYVQGTGKDLLRIVNKGDPDYLRQVSGLGVACGYSPGGSGPSVDFFRADLRKMVEDEVFVHPIHKEQIGKFY